MNEKSYYALLDNVCIRTYHSNKKYPKFGTSLGNMLSVNMYFDCVCVISHLPDC